MHTGHLASSPDTPAQAPSPTTVEGEAMQGLGAAQGQGPPLPPSLSLPSIPTLEALHGLLTHLAVTQLIAWPPLLSHRHDQKAATTLEGGSLSPHCNPQQTTMQPPPQGNQKLARKRPMN